MAFHARKSPSIAKQFHHCPGSLAFADSLPEKMTSNPPNKAGREGTAAHYLLQVCIEQGREPIDYLGLWIGINPSEDAEFMQDCTEFYRALIQVSEHMCGAVQVASDYIRAQVISNGIAPDGVELETRTNPLPDREDTSGRADITLASHAELELIDYKNGRIVVEVDDNEQLLAYLLGRAIDTKWKNNHYRMTIIQPNAPHAQGSIRSVSVTKAELRAFERMHRAAVEAVDTAALELETTPIKDWAEVWLIAGDHCTFCRGSGPCPARKRLSAKQVAASFGEAPSDLGEFDDIAEAVEVVKWAKQIRAHLDGAERYLEQALRLGRQVSGFCLTNKKCHRIWKPEIPKAELLARLLESVYFEKRAKERLRADWPLTGPQVEKLVKPAMRDYFSEEFLYRPEGELVLTRKA